MEKTLAKKAWALAIKETGCGGSTMVVQAGKGAKVEKRGEKNRKSFEAQEKGARESLSSVREGGAHKRKRGSKWKGTWAAYKKRPPRAVRGGGTRFLRKRDGGTETGGIGGH